MAMPRGADVDAGLDGLRQALAAETEARHILEQELLDTAAALQLSRERFHVLARRSPVGILQADPAGRCTYANEKWSDLTGLAPEETLGFEWSHAVHPDDVARVMDQWAASVEARRPYVNELRLVHRDGRILDVIAAAMPVLDDEGMTVGFIGTVMDITERNEFLRSLADREQVLRRLIEVQENEKRSLCHEFHDGLIQHAVGAKMLLESWLHEHPDAADAGVVMEAVRSLTRGIMDGRRTIRGIRPAVLDDLGLEAAIHDLLDGQQRESQLRERGGGADFEIERRVDDSIGPLPPQLQTTVFRVIQESLTNVRRHSASDRVVVELTRSGDDIRVVVEDFGAGFDVDAGRQRGCGLIGMLERVRLAGGECRITSAPGRGTRVEVRLRVAAAAPAG